MSPLRRLLSCLLLTSCLMASAFPSAEADSTAVIARPVTALFNFSIGSSHLADTYLSPIKYSGWSVGLGYERWQAMKFSPERSLMHLEFEVSTDRTHNLTGNAIMWNFNLNGDWSIMRKWRFPGLGGIVAGIGPGVNINLGCFYTARNGNNPASAKGSITIDAAGFIGKRFTALGKIIDLRWSSGVSLLGAFFSPDYGELYYEIWLGNHSGLAHLAWPGNFFRWHNSVTADLHLGNTILSLGYKGKIYSTKVNDITTRAFTHCFTLGIGGEWISVSPSKGLSPRVKMISAIY